MSEPLPQHFVWTEPPSEPPPLAKRRTVPRKLCSIAGDLDAALQPVPTRPKKLQTYHVSGRGMHRVEDNRVPPSARSVIGSAPTPPSPTSVLELLVPWYNWLLAAREAPELRDDLRVAMGLLDRLAAVWGSGTPDDADRLREVAGRLDRHLDAEAGYRQPTLDGESDGGEWYSTSWYTRATRRSHDSQSVLTPDQLKQAARRGRIRHRKASPDNPKSQNQYELGSVCRCYPHCKEKLFAAKTVTNRD